MNLQELNAIRESVIQKSETPFEKARGKTAFLGEIRIMGGKKWVKTSNGWVYQNKNGTHTHYDSKTKETERASDEHIAHYHEHVNKDTDLAIEAYKKGELPKEKVDKHFESPIPQIGDKVSITDEALSLISLSSLKGQKLTVIGEVKTGLISQPYFVKVKDEDGEEHELNPSYIEKVKEHPKVGNNESQFNEKEFERLTNFKNKKTSLNDSEIKEYKKLFDKYSFISVSSNSLSAKEQFENKKLSKTENKPKVEDKPKEKVDSLDKLNEIKESVSKPSSEKFNIKNALENLIKDNSRFSLKAVKGGFYLNKKDGNYAFISDELEYKQPKGSSWRSEINSYLKEFGIELKK